MAVDLANMNGNVRLCATAGGTATTNNIQATVKFSGLDMAKDANGNMTGTVNFESTGDVTVNGFTASTAVDIAGFGGNAEMYEGITQTTTAFQMSVGNWSASITGDTHPYSVFSSQWKKSGLGTFQLTGSASGVISTGQLMPAST